MLLININVIDNHFTYMVDLLKGMRSRFYHGCVPLKSESCCEIKKSHVRLLMAVDFFRHVLISDDRIFIFYF